MAEWYIEEIETRLSTHASEDVSASVYVTSTTASAEQEQEQQADDESKLGLPSKPLASSMSHVAVTRGPRPDLPALIEAASSARGKRVGIFVCGPASMLHDVRTAAARAQRGVLGGGDGNGDGVEEVYLHLEPFA